MKAGLQTEQKSMGIVPSLNTAAELPPPVEQSAPEVFENFKNNENG